MTVKNYLLDAGYKVAGVKLEDELLNSADNLLHGQELNKESAAAAFKYAALEKYNPYCLGNKRFSVEDSLYYSGHFWKIYPEA